MAFDLYKLARAAEFSFKLRGAGIVRCESLTSSLMLQSVQRIKMPDFESEEFARWLLGKLAKRPETENFQESDPIEGDSLTTEQLLSVTAAELEAFADHLLQKNLYLVKAHGGEELKREDGQSACDFLAHAFEHRSKEEKAQIDRLTQSAKGPFFVESTLDSIKKSLAASNQYEDLIKHYAAGATLDSIKKSLAASIQIESLEKSYAAYSPNESVLAIPKVDPQFLRFEPLPISKNPILETNQILENLTGQIEGMRPLVAQGAELIRGMHDTALRVQVDYVANAARSDRQTKIALLVAVLSLVASSFFSCKSYIDSKTAGEKAEAQIKVLEKGIATLVEDQRVVKAAVLKSFSEANRSITSAKK